MKEDMDPLDPELQALLANERSTRAPPQALNRIWTRVAKSLPPGGGGGAAPPIASAVGPRVVALLAAFTLGGGAGAFLYAEFRAPVVVYVDRTVVMTAATVTESRVAALAPPVPALAVSKPAGVERQPETGPAQSLDEERRNLDRARTALSQGDSAGALAAANEHERTFPTGQLREEREAIAVQALVLAKRHDEARARAARFRASFPDSVFLPVVDASLSTIPQ